MCEGKLKTLDIEPFVYSEFYCYADDIFFVMGAENLRCAVVKQRASAALEKLGELLALNGLELNRNKIELLGYADSPQKLGQDKPDDLDSSVRSS
ncbi:hypothetical protein V9T40_009461 [Parthenolecanium corni]|uniref:Uncharacterized protein n=1 Tax=Parthenolecanium corni TaxID=536013 RepID=A0AAN9TSJ1_9HEMI